MSRCEFAVLTVPNQPEAALSVKEVQAAAASTIGRQIEVLTVSTSRDIDAAFATIVQTRTEAILVGPDALFYSRLAQITTLPHATRWPRSIPGAKRSKPAD